MSRPYSTLYRALSTSPRWLTPLAPRFTARGMATTLQDTSISNPFLPPIQPLTSVQRNQSEAHSVASLVRNLRHYMGPKQGIDGTDVEVAHLRSLMARCRPGPEEWKRYGHIDPTRSYTRLHVDDINGKCNLLFIVWNAAAQSPIHNHANALCLMKIVKGTLNETVFDVPPQGPLRVQRDSFHGAGKIAFINDDIGVHRMTNPDQNNYAVSLHLYTPPHAADHGFKVYDQHTGQDTHIPGRLALSEPPMAQTPQTRR